jgi:cell division protein FtsZ
MNISGGTNLSLYEVQEAADVVASASDQEVNMIFGSVINDNLKDEIVVTVIATGFNESAQAKQPNPLLGQMRSQPHSMPVREQRREDGQEQQARPSQPPVEDTLDIPTFLRNRNRRR